MSNPASYDPGRASLATYLRMAARGDLWNLLRGEARHHLHRVAWSVVEDDEEGGNLSGREEEPVLPPGAVIVMIGGLPAARVGDECECEGPPDVIVEGSPNVLIEGQPAARLGDPTAHGGNIILGCPTVLIK